jgi:hypothetical protein
LAFWQAKQVGDLVEQFQQAKSITNRSNLIEKDHGKLKKE